MNQNKEDIYAECNICGHGTNTCFSINHTSEYMSERIDGINIYSHIDSESLLDVCETCCDDHLSPEQLYSRLTEMIARQINKPIESLISSGKTSQYMCPCCMNDIPDGSPIHIIDMSKIHLQGCIVWTLSNDLILLFCEKCLTESSLIKDTHTFLAEQIKPYIVGS